ncbi:MAG TPA: hypothetical protein VMX95_01185, partial [Thermodesulfobacteriota bacterium]|nr:hypothetical protein [Thermodesulfobacteriota bacterium]
MSSDFYTFGEPVQFKSLKYRGTIEFIESVNKHNYAKLRRILKKDGLECVEFDVSPERPTHPVADIRKLERICVIFEEDENKKPFILALRKSFPATLLHLNLGDYGGPRSLCLFEEDYRSIAHTLTPENFLLRIFSWLSRAASGEQHLPDQPLEPFV